MKKACMKCKSINNNYTWDEKYEVSDKTDSEQYLRNMIDQFNSTLRPKESAREILAVWEESLDDTEAKIPHTWEKSKGDSKAIDELLVDVR